MKLIAITLAALLAVGKVSAYSTGLTTFYGYICDDHE